MDGLAKDQPRASRFHAEIYRDAKGHWLIDRGSRWGTRLNGRKIKDRIRLVEGDCIEICGISLVFTERAANAGLPIDKQNLSEEPLSPHSSSILLPMEDIDAKAAHPQVEAIMQMLNGFGKSLEIEATAQELLSGLFSLFPQVERGFVSIASEGDLHAACEPIVFLQRNDNTPNEPFPYSRSIVKQVFESREALLSTRADDDRELPSAPSVQGLNVLSLVCIPLLDGDGGAIGVVQLDNGLLHEAFSPADLELMAAVTNQASIVVRYAQMHAEALRHQMLDHDLQLARRVQLALLPSELPALDSVRFHAYYEAANEVGGDLYDFVMLPNGRIAVVVADAAGKGVSAAILIAQLTGELKYYLSRENDVAGAVSCMNDAICEHSSGRFVTLLVFVIDPKTGDLEIVNAGHLAPLLRRQTGEVVDVGTETRGTALGLMSGFEYQATHHRLEANEVVCAFTDGFTEAMDPARQPYGDARIIAQLAKPVTSLERMCDDLVADVLSYTRGERQSDDMCMVACSYLPTGGEKETN